MAIRPPRIISLRPNGRIASTKRSTCSGWPVISMTIVDSPTSRIWAPHAAAVATIPARCAGGALTFTSAVSRSTVRSWVTSVTLSTSTSR